MTDLTLQATEGHRGPLPLVTIVVPVYNGEQYLEKSLETIHGQRYPNLEVIVVDDGSTDRTPEILASHQDSIEVIRHASNRGQFESLNSGLSRARGEFVAIHHSDDLYHPDVVLLEVEYARRHPDVGAVFCMDIFVDRDGKEFGRLELPLEVRGGRPLAHAVVLDAILKYRNTFVRGAGNLIRASVLREIGPFREDVAPWGDLEMWLRLSRHSPISILEEHLVRYRWGHENESKRYMQLREEPDLAFAIIDEHLATGGRQLASEEALRAYEGWRAEDLLLVAATRYVTRRRDARGALRRARLSALLGMRGSRRLRLLLLFALLHVFLRLPRIPVVAGAFQRRWHGWATPVADAPPPATSL